MKNINDKVNNVTTEEGFLTAEETNSMKNEIANAVSTYFQLNPNSETQLAGAMDASSKALVYTDTGSVNAIELVRPSITDNVETMIDGMSIMFRPKVTNTSIDVTIKLNDLPSKRVSLGNGTMIEGSLQNDELYMGIFDKADDKFYVYQISTNVSEYAEKIDHVSMSELNNASLDFGTL